MELHVTQLAVLVIVVVVVCHAHGHFNRPALLEPFLAGLVKSRNSAAQSSIKLEMQSAPTLRPSVNQSPRQTRTSGPRSGSSQPRATYRAQLRRAPRFVDDPGLQRGKHANCNQAWHDVWIAGIVLPSDSCTDDCATPRASSIQNSRTAQRDLPRTGTASSGATVRGLPFAAANRDYGPSSQQHDRSPEPLH